MVGVGSMLVGEVTAGAGLVVEPGASSPAADVEAV
jgi:hypothetical protein